MQPLIELRSSRLKYTGVSIENPHHVTIPSGVTVVFGANASGKSSLAAILQGGWNFLTNDIKAPSGLRPTVRVIAFNDIHSLSGFKVEYYQQRYESTMNDDVPTISELLGERARLPQWQRLASMLGLDSVLDKRANYLSSGELRKFLIANALLDLPDVLVLDNPYIGLDAASQVVVDAALRDIAAAGTSLLLLISDSADIPAYADTLLPMHGLSLLAPVDCRACGSIEAVRSIAASVFAGTPDIRPVTQYIRKEYAGVAPQAGEPIVEMRHCRVAYGRRTLVDDVDWTIRQGECWSLTGPNGSGKSTLLSLINADNPQAYANDISLFGRRRGTGESIWEIKDKIGFMSSELHLFFNTHLNTCRQVVAGGMSSFARATTADKALDPGVIDGWLRVFGLEAVADVPFRNLSYGQQTLTLFLRAIIKRPLLLILDEPMHGVDEPTKRLIASAVDTIAALGVSVIFVTHCPAELPASVSCHKSLGR